MKRSFLAFGCLFLASPLAAQTPSPAQMGITPTTTPEVLQVLDSAKAWSTLGTVDPATHIFTPVGGPGVSEADILVTDPTVGMRSGGTDNSPFVLNLMRKIASTPGGAALNGGYDVLFPGVPGQSYTEYYFSNTFTNSRWANYHCSGGTPYPSTILVFAPGIDGFLQEDGKWTPDGGTGAGMISGCGIATMGTGSGILDTHTPKTMTSSAFFGDPAGLLPLSTWHVGDGIMITAYQNCCVPSSAIPAVPMGAEITSVSGTTVTLSADIAPSLSQATGGANATAVFTQTGTNNFSLNDTIQVGPNTYKFATAAQVSAGSVPLGVLLGATFDASVANLVASINGTVGEYNTYVPNLVGENAYLNDANVSVTYTPGSGVIQFASRFPGQDTNSFPSVYTPAGATAGTFGGATFSGATGGGAVVRFIQLPGPNAPVSRQFKIQTTAGSNSVTVISGPRLLHGGDVIVSDAFPFGTTVFINSGTSFPQTVTMNVSTMGASQNATVTHAPGAEGDLWIMPAGVQHRTASSAEHLTINNWAIGELLACSSGSGVNCDLSRDEDIFHAGDWVGRWVSGNNTSTSSSINEQFSNDYIVDIFEGGTLGEVYFNPNMESPESSHAKWTTLKNCANQNYSLVFGSYAAGGNSGCATPSGMIPPTPGGLTIWGELGYGGVGNQMRGYANGTFWGATNFEGGNDYQHTICINPAPGIWYDVGFSYAAGCPTGETLGLGFSAAGGAWAWNVTNTHNVQTFIYPAAGYLGYNVGGAPESLFYVGALFGGESQGLNLTRHFEMTPSKPVLNGNAAGNVSINISALPGGSAEWIDVPVFSTTLTAPVAVGATTATVAACPTATIPASLFLSDMGAAAAGAPKTLGTYSSCTSLTMTISAALNAGVTGDTVKIIQWTPAAPIANDGNGTVWSIENPTTIALLPACASTNVGTAIVTNGIAAPTYLQAVSATGSSTRKVWCDGTVWLYD